MMFDPEDSFFFNKVLMEMSESRESKCERTERTMQGGYVWWWQWRRHSDVVFIRFTFETSENDMRESNMQNKDTSVVLLNVCPLWTALARPIDVTFLLMTTWNVD